MESIQQAADGDPDLIETQMKNFLALLNLLKFSNF